MIKRLVCFDDESLNNLDLLMRLMKMNRSQLIRYLLRDKAEMVRANLFSTKEIENHNEKSLELPFEEEKL